MNHVNYGTQPTSKTDLGPKMSIINIDRAANTNNYYRTALWTGEHLQVTLMSIPVGGDIGLEMHDNVDQFIRIESGHAVIMSGTDKTRLTQSQPVNSNYAIIIPAGTWHNIINADTAPLKLYSVYAPPKHPYGTVHKTKSDAQAQEKSHDA